VGGFEAPPKLLFQAGDEDVVQFDHDRDRGQSRDAIRVEDLKLAALDVHDQEVDVVRREFLAQIVEGAVALDHEAIGDVVSLGHLQAGGAGLDGAFVGHGPDGWVQDEAADRVVTFRGSEVDDPAACGADAVDGGFLDFEFVGADDFREEGRTVGSIDVPHAGERPTPNPGGEPLFEAGFHRWRVGFLGVASQFMREKGFNSTAIATSEAGVAAGSAR